MKRHQPTPNPLRPLIKSISLAGITLCVLLISACTAAQPTPAIDGPILNGPDALPKRLATVAPSQTPLVQATPTDDGSRPTVTIPPPTLTPTSAPLIGSFIGSRSFPDVEGTFTWNPTRVAQVVIVTIRPGSRTPPPQAAYIPSGPGPAGAFNPVIGGGVIAGSGNMQAIPATSAAPRTCSKPPAGQFAGAFAKYGQIVDRLGCPVNDAFGLRLVSEPFQNGVMFWRETKEMFALASNGQYFRVMDQWNDGLPASDPSLAPPTGFSQPVRGFGYAWRNNGAIKGALGWALGSEQAYDGTWQDFERGFMITGLNGTIYALIPLSNDGGQHLGMMTN